MNELTFELMIKNTDKKAWSDILVDIYVETLTESKPLDYLVSKYEISKDMAQRTYLAGRKLMGC